MVCSISAGKFYRRAYIARDNARAKRGLAVKSQTPITHACIHDKQAKMLLKLIYMSSVIEQS